MNDLTFGMRLTYDGKSAIAGIEETRAKVDTLAASSSRMASSYSGLNQTVRQHNTEVKETASNVNKLLDRYDPLGAKLRQLQNDFKALDSAASSGKIAGRDDGRVDQAHAAIQQQMEMIGKVSGSSAASMSSLGLNTQYARREMMQLGKEVVMGDFSRMPQTFASLITHTQLLPALFSPLGAAVAGVTAIVAAGAIVWESYGNSLDDFREKIKKTSGDLTLLSREQLNKRLSDLREQYDQKRAEASSGGWGWMKEGKEAGALDAESVRIGKELDARRAQEERLGDVDRKQSGRANDSEYAKRLDLLEAIKAQEKYTDLQREGSQEQLKSLSALKELKESLAAIDERSSKESQKIHDKELKDYQAYLRALEELKKLHADSDLSREQRDQKEWEEQVRKNQAARKVPFQAEEEANKFIDRARTTSAEYVNQLEFENAMLGKSAVEVQRLTEFRRIDLALEKELLALRGNEKFATRTTNPEVDAAFQRAIVGAQEAADAARQGADRELAARREINASWEHGALVSMRKYQDEAENTAAMTEKAFSRSIKGMEDAEIKFIRTTKMDWASMGDIIINELLRIQVAKFNAGLMSYATSLFSDPLMSAPAMSPDYRAPGISPRASGGPVSANSLYRVNERGPELLNMGGNDYLMMGGSGGYVKPLGSEGGVQGGGNVVSIQVSVDASGNQTQSSSNNGGFAQLGTRIAEATRGVIMDEMRPGGLLAGARP